MTTDAQHVFVVGLDDFNKQELEKLNSSDSRYRHCRFHELLTYRDLGQTQAVSFDDLLEKARHILKNSDTPVDGIMSFWDFPAQSLVPLLCREFGLPSCSPDSVEKCEHKYWARILQREYVPQATPAFAAVDPMDDGEAIPDLDFPFWLKPVKSYSSYLAYKINNRQEFDDALAVIRDKIGALARPYNEMLAHMTLPDDISRVDGNWCIAEEVIGGDQFTVEGYCHDGDFHAHGIIDSIDERHSSSFARYQYPTHLPFEVQERMLDISRRLMTGIGFDNSAFNIEFFYDADSDALNILEVNPRISQSHSGLFKMVDGLSNEAISVALALGEKPQFPHREGDKKLAGKFFLRAHDDAFVTQVPDRHNLQAIHRRFPDIDIKIQAGEGTWLSEDELHDSYSFELAQVFVGADTEGELLSRYRECVEMMEFTLEDTDEDTSMLISKAYQPDSRQYSR